MFAVTRIVKGTGWLGRDTERWERKRVDTCEQTGSSCSACVMVGEAVTPISLTRDLFAPSEAYVCLLGIHERR